METTQTRTASVIGVERLKTHVRLLVKDSATHQRHYLLLQSTNVVFTNGDVLIYDDHAAVDSLTHPGISRVPLPRLLLYWDHNTGKVVDGSGNVANTHVAQD